MKPISQRMARFCMMAPVSFSLNIGLTAFFHETLAFPEKKAVAIALTLVFITNFFLNRHLVFKSTWKSEHLQFFQYILCSAGFRMSEYMFFILIFNIFNVPYLAVYISVLAISFLIKFIIYHILVFDTNSK